MLIFIGGGARSGKSAFALRYARRLGGGGLFLATGQPSDDEMAARIDRHRADRGAEFETVEEPLEVGARLGAADPQRVVVLDCVTLWLSNLLLAGVGEAEIARGVAALAEIARSRPGPVLVVTNEVGMGIVPETPLGRAFRDLAGGAHQRLAGAASEIYAALLGVVVRLRPTPLISFSALETP